MILIANELQLIATIYKTGPRFKPHPAEIDTNWGHSNVIIILYILHCSLCMIDFLDTFRCKPNKHAKRNWHQVKSILYMLNKLQTLVRIWIVNCISTKQIMQITEFIFALPFSMTKNNNLENRFRLRKREHTYYLFKVCHRCALTIIGVWVRRWRNDSELSHVMLVAEYLMSDWYFWVYSQKWEMGNWTSHDFLEKIIRTQNTSQPMYMICILTHWTGQN